MNRIGFAFNPTSNTAIDLRERALAWAAERGVEAWASPAADRAALAERLPQTDVLVVLGGDGTFLRAAAAVAQVDVPILGVNGGKVGFLSKTESDALEDVLDLVAADRFTVEARMVIDARIMRAHTGAPPDQGYVALNEAAVVRGSQARVVRLELAIDETHVATYICDGIVVSSPTGSTGYSNSAGGPILDPTARNLVVTPIAAYLAAIRSIVTGPQHTVTVRVIDAFDCLVSIDGQEDIPLTIGDAVQVRARERPIHVVEPEGAIPFWDLLRRKAQLLPS
ncbi:MAG: kinase [Chloroflexota bacterium]|jgi:NAD+ kinase|nr:kinase [Chloroflexota bacterium]